MTAPSPWPPRHEETLLDCGVLQVARLSAASPHTGREHGFTRLHAPDWVNVVALTAQRELVFVRQWRHGAGRVTLEIPGGMVDPGETPAQAAARELEEETGYRAGSLRALGSVSPNPALFTNRCHTFLAADLELRPRVHVEGTEETVVALVPEAHLPALLRAGEIDHALVVVALQWYALGGVREGAVG